MGEGDLSAYKNVVAENKSEAFTEKKNAEKDEIKEVEEEGKEAGEKDIENMDIDKEEVKEEKESPDVMEEETVEKPDKNKEVEDVTNLKKGERQSHKDHEIEKGSKESDTSGSGARKKDRKRKRQVEDKKELEPKTPLASTIERPVRQRKSVERLVASIEGELTKEIHIEKGRGTALKDIPNVAYKLSKRKADDTLKILHTILFGRRGKAAQFKSNISRFSGFVWHENEEKQKMKVKEKLDKCVREKLLELCDVLDVPVAKDTSTKEDLVLELMDFLEAPHSTTSELLAENDQSSKGKKRERVSKKNPSATGSLEGSTKSRKTEGAPRKAEKRKKKKEDDKEEGPEMIKGVHERSHDELSNQAESKEKDSESEEESEKDKKKHEQSSLSSKEPAGKVKTKKTQVSKRPSPPTKKTHSKSSKGAEKNDNIDANPKVYSKKKTTEVVKGKKVLTRKGHKKADILRPSDDELRRAICEVLKEVDFNTATFTDILMILAKRYDTDLTPRKSSVKNMIQDELTRLVDEADEQNEEGNAEEDEKQPSVQGVEA